MTEATDTASSPTSVSTELRTFLIADVRGYTRFTMEHGDEAAARLAGRFAEIAEDMVAARGGRVIELRGDEALAVFPSARQALRTAVEMQTRFAEETQAHPEIPLRVGAGLDAGEAIPVKGGYRGAALNLAARLCALAGPGEVLASEGVVHLARKMDGLNYVERGLAQLKGFDDPVGIVQVVPSSVADGGRLSQAGSEQVTPDLEGRPLDVGSREQRLPIGGFLGALPSSVLVGRHEELKVILTAVDSVADGGGRMVLLVGEPGIGKTRLAQEATLKARNRGFLVATGRCYEPEQVVPYYPFREALGTLYSAAQPVVQAEVAMRWPDVQRLLPGATTPPSTGGGQEEQQRLFWALTAFLQAMAAQSPIAVLLDDLHWADDSSLKLLQHLARYTRGDRVLLLGTYRDVDVQRQHPLERMLRDLNREGIVERVPVRRFAQDETAALTAATFGEAEISDEFASLLHLHTEGNPFFVQEVLRALVERGDVYQEDGRWERRKVDEIEVPESVRSAIGERLSRLGETAQSVLSEASVLGQTFRFEELQQTGGRSEDEVEAALEEAMGVGLVADMGRDRYTFNHALTQQALYAELSTRRRRRLHLAAGEALQRLQSARRGKESESDRRAAELAWHFLEGDDPERALPYTMLAGDQAAELFAHGEAERHYRTAAELARELDDTEQEATALEKLGATLQAEARYDEAIDNLDRAVTLYRAAGDAEGERTATARLGRLHGYRGAPDDGVARIRALLEKEPDEASHGVAALHAALAQVYFESGRYRESLAASERASQIARAIGDDRILAEAEMRRGSELMNLGSLEEGLRVLEAILPLVEAAGDTESLSRALNNIAFGCWIQGKLDRHREYRERALEVAQQSAMPAFQAFMLAGVGQALYYLGDLEGAQRNAEQAVKIRRSTQLDWGFPYSLFTLAWVYVAQGRWEEARQHGEEAVEIATRVHDPQALSVGYSVLAELAILDGQPGEGADRLAPYTDSPLPGVQTTFAWALVEAGDEGRAHEVLTQTLRTARERGAGTVVAEALRVQGTLLGRQERWDDAEQSLDEALPLAREMGYRIEEGRILYEIGAMHSRKGSERAVRERPLREALKVFQGMGAKPYAERTERLLAGDL